MEDNEKINIVSEPGMVLIPSLGADPIECVITGDFDIVDKNSGHIHTNKGVFLISTDYVKIDGKEFTDIESLKAEILYQRQRNLT
jgi:hypothetical protein